MKDAGFTAIELLAVLAIILTIVAIGIPAYNSWRDRSKIEKTKAVISKLEMALEMYKTDFGEYPRSGMLYKLKEVESSGYGPYIDSKDYKNNKFYDSWDRVIQYEKTDDTVSLLSHGPDENDLSDDISNIKVK